MPETEFLKSWHAANSKLWIQDARYPSFKATVSNRSPRMSKTVKRCHPSTCAGISDIDESAADARSSKYPESK